MGDLSCLKQTTSISAIDLDYETRYKPRLRLGLSQIGHECDRFLWYKHNGQIGKQPDGKVLRLFQMGNMVEEQMVIDLKSAGFTLHSQQKAVEFTQDDLKLTGSCDGIIEGLLESQQPHLWECKSMGSKGYSKLLKDGYEAYNPSYKAQLHTYMLGLKLKRAFVTVYNKDTSELYQERVRLDRDYAVEMLRRAFDIIGTKKKPDRIQNRPDFYSCKWCDYHTECFNL